MEKNMISCKECQNSTRDEYGELHCVRPGLRVGRRRAYVERLSNHYTSCGPRARHFEQKETFWGKIVALLKNIWP